MKQTKKLVAVSAIVLASMGVAAASAFAESRHDQRTSGTSVTVRSKRVIDRRVVGVISSVTRNGFYVDTGRERLPIFAPYKFRVNYRRGSRTLTVRDLRRGDRVDVRVDREHRLGLRASSIELIEPQSLRLRPGTRPESHYADGAVRGTVTAVNRRLGTFTVRTSRGELTRVDAMDVRDRTSRGQNPIEWLKAGDYVIVTGDEGRDGIFRADDIRIDGTRGGRYQSERYEEDDRDDDRDYDDRYDRYDRDDEDDEEEDEEEEEDD